MQTPEEKIEQAITHLVMDERFFAYLILSLKFVRDDSQPTMATDGKRVYWGGKFVEKLDLPPTKTVLVHEGMHCGLGHFARRGHRDPKRWNIATDYEINELISEFNEKAQAANRTTPFPFPQGALLNKAYRGKCAEEIYELLPENAGKDCNSNDPGGMGAVIDADGEDGQSQTEAQKELQEKWTRTLMSAVQQCDKKGDLPASLKRLVDELLEPKRNWRDILKDIFKAMAKDDYSWRVRNLRYGGKFFLPSFRSEKMGKIAVAVDTSGSIGPDILNDFLAEIEGIAHECKPESIILIDCDAQINMCDEFQCGDTLPREFTGGGGTDFRPVFEKLKEFSDVEALIYFTDTYGCFPEEAPEYKTIWATIGDGVSLPFGQQVKIRDF